ncbi:MAG TPA: hypothetical protein VD737_10860 [Steroidobacteraceae bacterium]|nr:hypothetical protein [Steroidobacteraceae bacterium]
MTYEICWKLAYTVFVAIVVAIWLRHYGWRNLLWFSDIALIGAVPALWLESSAIASVLAVAVLVPELLWNVDFGLRLLLRRRITGLTDYMFERERPRMLRVVSALFHVPLPILLLWMLAEYGYDGAAGLPGAVLLAAVVLPWSRAVSSPERNINWTHGLGPIRTRLPAQRYVLQLFVGFVLLVFIPTHLLLRAVFPPGP